MPPSEKSNPFDGWVIVCDGVRTWIGRVIVDEPENPLTVDPKVWAAQIAEEEGEVLSPFYEVLMRSNTDGSIELVCLPPMLCTGELVLECSPTSTIECRGFSPGDQAQWAGRIAEAERLRAGKAGAG